MKKWYQGIVVEHKEISNKMYHCFDDENFKTLIEERNEQLKEIERLHSIIKEVREDIEYCIPVLEQEEEMSTDERSRKETGELKELLKKRLEILDKESRE